MQCYVCYVSSLGKNPYRPGTNLAPAYLAGREEALRDFERMLDASPEIPANLRLTGLRGVGKSVLLGEFEKRAEAAGWLTARHELQPRHNSEEALESLIRSISDTAIRRCSLSTRVRDVASALVRTIRWNAPDGLEFSIDPQASSRTGGVAESLADATKVALDHSDSGFILLLDEAQVLFDDHRAKRQEHPLSMLISAVSGLQSTGAPIALVLCGLPTLQSNLLRARTYSERMFRGERVDSLDTPNATAAFVRPLDTTPVSVDDDTIDAVLGEVDGYPYFIQLWGAELWDAAKDLGSTTLGRELLRSIRPRIYRRLDRDFYEGRLATLTPAEQDLLIASANVSYPPLRVSDLRGVTSKTERYVNVLVGRLTEAGVIYREAKGTYRYTAPQFHEFLKRHVKRHDDAH